MLAQKEHGELHSRVLFSCQFVPLLGRYGWSQEQWQSDLRRWGRGQGYKRT
jgi:hypothetical protein